MPVDGLGPGHRREERLELGHLVVKRSRLFKSWWDTGGDVSRFSRCKGYGGHVGWRRSKPASGEPESKAAVNCDRLNRIPLGSAQADRRPAGPLYPAASGVRWARTRRAPLQACPPNLQRGGVCFTLWPSWSTHREKSMVAPSRAKFQYCMAFGSLNVLWQKCQTRATRLWCGCHHSLVQVVCPLQSDMLVLIRRQPAISINSCVSGLRQNNPRILGPLCR